jgi:hypothetical protein
MKTLTIIFISLVLFAANAPSYGASLYEGKTITIGETASRPLIFNASLLAAVKLGPEQTVLDRW